MEMRMGDGGIGKVLKQLRFIACQFLWRLLDRKELSTFSGLSLKLFLQ